MTDKFQVEELPEVDQREIKRGRCPWCLETLFDTGDHDQCADCGDEFYGKITIED